MQPSDRQPVAVKCKQCKQINFLFTYGCMYSNYGDRFFFVVSLQRKKMTIGMTNKDEELLVKILNISHQNVMAGKSYSQEEAERFLDQRLYEFRDKMVGTSNRGHITLTRSFLSTIPHSRREAYGGTYRRAGQPLRGNRHRGRVDRGPEWLGCS